MSGAPAAVPSPEPATRGPERGRNRPSTHHEGERPAPGLPRLLRSALGVLAGCFSPAPAEPSRPAEAGLLDVRSISTALGAWTAASLLVLGDPRWSLLLTTGLGALLALLFWVLLRNRGMVAWSHHWWSPVAAAGVGVFLVAAGISTHTLAQRDPTFGSLADAGSTIRFEAVVTGDARKVQPARGGAKSETVLGEEATGRSGRQLVLIDVRVQRYTSAGSWHAGAANAVLLFNSGQGPPVGTPVPGQRLGGLGRLSHAEPGERHGYWLRATSGVAALDGAAGAQPTERWRKRLATGSAVLPGEGAALLPGMVMGDRSAQSSELSADMKTAGLAHLTAVSGANVAMILGAVLWACRICHVGRWPALFLSLAGLAGFVVLVHPEPSVIRAAVMGGIGALAVYAGRGRQALTALSVCTVLVLAWDPWFAREPAFQLSVLATAGIVLMGRRLAALCRHIMPAWFADGVAVSTSAQLFCLPVLLGLAPVFSTYSVPANVLAAPLVPVVTVVGTAGLVLAALPGPWLQPFIWVAGIPASWIGGLGHLAAGLPGAALPWPPGAGGRLAAVLVMLLGVVAVWSASSPPPRDEGEVPRRWIPGAIAETRAGHLLHRIGGRHDDQGWRRRMIAMGAAVSGMGLLGGLTAPATVWLPATTAPWEMAACDVGQGDSFVLRSGAESAVLVDTGPDPALVDHCLAALGVHTIDALFITHLHADHAGGVSGALHGRPVNAAYFSTGTGRSVLPGLPSGIRATKPLAGATGRAGDVSWTVIGPLEDPTGEEENNASLVIVFRMTGGPGPALTMLATGDMEEQSMRQVLHAHPGLRVDVLKVGHHGAKNGGTDVITASRARMALIGVGAGNSYGHPAPSTLQALRAAGMHTYRTDMNGTIRLHATPGGQLVARGRRGP